MTMEVKNIVSGFMSPCNIKEFKSFSAEDANNNNNNEWRYLNVALIDKTGKIVKFGQIGQFG